MNALNEFEIRILLWIQNSLRFPALDFCLKCITLTAEYGIIAYIVILLLFAMKKYRRVSVTCAISLAFEFILCNLIFKPLVARIRPFDLCTELIPLVNRLTDYSFPSGHAGCAFAVAMVIVYMMPKKWGIPAIVFALLIAYSRLHVGVHYPTDVLAATLCGIFTAWVARKIINRVWKVKKKNHKHKRTPAAA